MSASVPPPPDLMSPEHAADPWPGLAVLRDHYPVHFDERLGSWLISRYEDIRPINRKFGPGPVYQDYLGRYLADTLVYFAMEGQDHRRRRALMTPYFARDGVEKLRDGIERQARALLDPILERERKAVANGERERGEMEFVTEFASAFSLNVMAELLGFDVADGDRMRRWVTAWIDAEGNISGNPVYFERAEVALQDWREYVRPIIAERRGGDGDDLISVLGRSEIDGEPLSDEEIQSLAGVMIHAGGETTGHQLEWLVYELIRHPDAQRELVEDRGLMGKVLAESMRHSAIVQYSARNVTEDVEVGGVKIEAGTPLAMMLAAGNRDPRRWTDPDTFDIHRTDHDASKAFAGSAEHLAFGGGPHFCLGSHVSGAELEIALDVLFESVRDVRFAEGSEPQLNVEASVFVRSFSELRISFDLI